MVITNNSAESLAVEYFVSSPDHGLVDGVRTVGAGETVTVEDIWLPDAGITTYGLRYGSTYVSDQVDVPTCPATELTLSVNDSACDLSAFGVPYAGTAAITLTNNSTAAYRYQLHLTGLDHGVVLDRVVEVGPGASVTVDVSDLQPDYYTASVREESSDDPEGFTWSNQEQLGTCRIKFELYAGRDSCFQYGATALTTTTARHAVLRGYAGDQPHPEITGILLGEELLNDSYATEVRFPLERAYRYTSLVLVVGNQTVLLDSSESEACSLIVALPTVVVSCRQAVLHNPARDVPMHFTVIPGANRGDGNLPPWVDVTLAGGELRTVSIPPDGDALWMASTADSNVVIAGGEMTELAQCPPGEPSTPDPSAPTSPTHSTPPAPDAGQPPLADTGSGAEAGWVGLLAGTLLMGGLSLVAAGRRRD